MDKKTTRRIIGVLVMIAMVIIVLPLLMNGRPGLSSLPMAEVKTPPFPEPRNETDPIPASMIAKSSTGKTVITSTGNKHGFKTTETSFAASPLVNTALEAKDQIDKAQEAAISTEPKVSVATATADEKVYLIDSKGVVTPSTEGTIVKMAAAIVGAKKPAETTTVAKVENKPALKAAAVEVAPASVTAKAKQAIEAAIVTAKAKSEPYAAISAKTKSAATPAAAPIVATAKAMAESISNVKAGWVVQMGTFKNKDNAVNLTNALRAKGYKAFMREAKKTGFTFVYVGPEFKEALASTLKTRIHQDIKMRGMIVPYKA